MKKLVASNGIIIMFLLFRCEIVMLSLSIIGDLFVITLAISLTHIIIYVCIQVVDG